MATDVTVLPATWAQDGRDIRSVREAVFVDEQGIPAALDFDGVDGACAHVVAYSGGGVPVGTGRLQADGHIGRMAVLRDWRGRGIGTRLLRALVELAAQRGLAAVYLHAQTHALPFYEKRSFRPVGPTFVEAGIPHRKMTKILLA